MTVEQISALFENQSDLLGAGESLDLMFCFDRVRLLHTDSGGYTPKSETPKITTPKSETPQIETPKSETPQAAKSESPQIDTEQMRTMH